MSQLRVRKPPGASDANKNRASAVKAAGDNAPSSKPKEQNHKNKSKKIPKKIQYDLENALVGLCDVWFEEIKPHLVRNNIKLHVEGAGPAGGDHLRLPVGAPGCSHDDPGAASDRAWQASVSSAGCCSARPAASRAPFHKPPARPRPPGPPQPPPCSPPTRFTHDLTPRNKSPRSLPQKNPHRQRGNLLNKPYWRDQHLTQDNAVPTLDPSDTVMNKLDSLLPSSRPNEDIYVPNNYHRRVKTQDECSQTEPVSIIFKRQLTNQHTSGALGLKAKESKMTIAVGDSLNKITSQNTFPTRNSMVQKHRPTVPPLRYSPPQITMSKTHILQKKTSRTVCTKNECNKCLTDKSTSLEPKSIFSYNRQENMHRDRRPMLLKGRYTLKHRDKAKEDSSVLLQKRYKSPASRPKSPPIRSKLSENRTSTPKVKYASPEVMLRENSPSKPSELLDKLPLQKNKSSEIKPLSRQMSKTSFFPISHKNKESREQVRDKREKGRSRNRNKATHPLFDSDLIDIIAEKNDRRVRVLYQSPDRKESCSTMLHLYSPSDKRERSSSTKRYKIFKPWK